MAFAVAADKTWNREKEDGTTELKNKIMEILRRKTQACCTTKKLKQLLPITTWLPKYNSEDLLGDAIAGLTVGLTVIPQGIAYALIAGLPPNYGLYSAFMGCFVYVLFGSCKDITIGPTAIMSILTYEYTAGNPDIAVLVCFTSGIIILLFGIFNLGFLIALVSKPVITGFTSAAAITIASSQLKSLFGIKIKADGLIETWVEVVKHITETRWQDLTLGLICIIVLLLMKKMRELKRFKKQEDDSFSEKAIKMTVFLLSVGRNAIIVIIATVIAALLDENQPFSITGDIKPGLPDVQIPPFSTNNGTTSFTEMMAEVGSGVIILPLIAILENIAIGSAFAQGKTINATQEMIALGLCNIVGSFFQSMPTTGSFSRTAVNATSGVRTTAGGIVTGVIIVLALAVLTPFFKYIPKSALAAVIICAVIFMIEYHEIVPIWKVRKADQLVLWTSFLVCIFWKLEYGIVLGVLVNLGVLLYGSANPTITVIPFLEEYSNIPPHIIVRSRVGLLYTNVDKLRTHVTKAGLRVANGVYPVIIDCIHFSAIDYSASKGMAALNMDFRKRDQPLFFMNATPGVRKGLKATNPHIEIIDQENVIEYLERKLANVEILGDKSIKIVTKVHHLDPLNATVSDGTQTRCNGIQNEGQAADQVSNVSNEEKRLLTTVAPEDLKDVVAE